MAISVLDLYIGVFGECSDDMFAGTPIYASAGFPAPSVTLDFQMTAQF